MNEEDGISMGNYLHFKTMLKMLIILDTIWFWLHWLNWSFNWQINPKFTNWMEFKKIFSEAVLSELVELGWLIKYLNRSCFLSELIFFISFSLQNILVLEFVSQKLFLKTVFLIQCSYSFSLYFCLWKRSNLK